MSRKAIIIGAGPAGLTAAYELLTRTDIKPIILEKSGEIGGISKTVNYKGNRIDIGGHRFFSKSDRVMQWWLNMMPIEPLAEKNLIVTYQRHSRTITSEEPFSSSARNQQSEKVLLVRRRLSRIYFLRKFFSYPIQLSMDTLKKLGFFRTIAIIGSYLRAQVFSRKPEASLEDFFINRFGKKLYLLFFKDYTEKVWGVSCTKISAEWGAQRIKGISIWTAVAHAAKSFALKRNGSQNDIAQRDTETSLIEKFLYPKLGPGQLWEEVAKKVTSMGGEIRFYQKVTGIRACDSKITGVDALDMESGDLRSFEGEFFFSTMPVQELIDGMKGSVPAEVRDVAQGLQYRDFITVGVLLSKFSDGKMLPDTWIYIQERDVKVGRLQIFNNWSPFMVKDTSTVWIGMEYFCNEKDSFWNLTDAQIQDLAINELVKMGLALKEDVIDSTVLRMEKTYPAYFGSYNRFEVIRRFTDSFENLFLVGRNGMHKYNNSDHSMLTAMVAVDNVIEASTCKANIWAVNTEQEYHEEKSTADRRPADNGVGMVPRAGDRFLDWLWNTPTARAWWIAGFASLLLQIILFKIRFPYANYMPDSYSYLEAAATNVDINMWPVAYSKFLRQVSVFTHSDKILVAIQYFFMQISGLVFLLSMFYLIRPHKLIQKALLIFFVFNPAILYMSNYISADSLFIGFSFLWMASLLWIIYKPARSLVVLQAILLLACFNLRYNAIYYPLISIVVFIIIKKPWYWRLSGIVASVSLILTSILYTSSKMQEVTGHRQFSAFGGWQLANNALYMYQDIPAAEREPVPAKFARLESMVDRHMDTLNRVKFTREDTVSCHFYLWSPNGPLIQYMVRQWNKDSTTPYFKRWASVAPLYAEYGEYLIRKYPFAFFKSVLVPNAIRYAAPPAEFLQIYNMGKDSVDPLAKAWFEYKTRRVADHNALAHKLPIMQWYTAFVTVANVLFLICIAGFILFQGFQRENVALVKVIVLFLLLWLINAGFSILASPVVLRYQLFPVLVALPLALIILASIYKIALEDDQKLKLQIA